MRNLSVKPDYFRVSAGIAPNGKALAVGPLERHDKRRPAANAVLSVPLSLGISQTPVLKIKV